MAKAVVLVVESEALIRLNTVQTLEDGGHTVLDVCNGDAAMEILESRSDINAVFTDVQMTGSLSGLALASAIRHRFPRIHLIVTSGRDAPKDTELPLNGRFIRKPYEGHQLLAMLADLPDTE
jgi:CheY-like chemotaxis protein